MRRRASNNHICENTGVKIEDELRHLGLRGDGDNSSEARGFGVGVKRGWGLRWDFPSQVEMGLERGYAHHIGLSDF